jgi:hypothetical protein
MRNMVATPEKERGGDEPVDDGVKAVTVCMRAELAVTRPSAALDAEVPEEADAQGIETIAARTNELALGSIDDERDSIDGLLEDEQRRHLVQNALELGLAELEDPAIDIYPEHRL